MSEKGPRETGFNRRRTPNDPWVASLLERHELPGDASIEEVEQTVKALWPSPEARLDAMALVLGRRIDGREPAQDLNLAQAFMVEDPVQAFAGLLMLADMEEMRAEGPLQ